MLKWILALLFPVLAFAQSDSKMLRSSNTIPDGRILISDNAYGPRYARDSGLTLADVTNMIPVGGGVYLASNQTWTGINGYSNSILIYPTNVWPTTNTSAYKLFAYDIATTVTNAGGDVGGTNIVLLLHGNGTNGSTWFPDSATNNCAMVAVDNAHVTNEVKFGSGSIALDGAGDIVTCTNQITWDFGTGNWSVEFWAWPDGAQADFAGMIGALTLPASGWSIAIQNTTKKPGIFSTASGGAQWDLVAANSLPNNTWTHVAFSRVGNTLKVFTNGIESGSADVTGYNYGASKPLHLGRFYGNFADYYWKGNIDEVRIMSTVAAFTNSFSVPTSEYGIGGTVATNHSYYLYAIGPDGTTNQLAPTVGAAQTNVYGVPFADYATLSGTASNVLALLAFTNQVRAAQTNAPQTNQVGILWAESAGAATDLTARAWATYGSNTAIYASNGVVTLNSQTNSYVRTNDNRYLDLTNANIRVNDARTGTNAANPVTWGDWRAGGDPMGFPDYQFGSWSQNFTFASLTFSNILLNGSADYYYKGQKITKTNSSSIQISAANGAHFIYYDDASDTLKESMVPWNFSNVVQVAVVYKNDSQAFIGNELHGTSMSWQQHENGHAQGSLVLANSFGGLVAATTGFSFGQGSWKDEDIKFTMPVQNNCSLVYHTNATTMAWTGMQIFPYLTNLAGNIVFDTLTTTQAVQNGYYVATWLVAADSWPASMFCIIGQREDSNLANARANATWASLDLEGYPSQEIRPLYRLLWHRQGGNNVFDEAADYRVDRFSAVGTAASFPYPPSDTNLYGMRSNLWEVIPTSSGTQTNVLGVQYANNAGSLTGFSLTAYGVVSNNTAIMAGSTNNWNIGVTNLPPNWVAVSNNALIATTNQTHFTNTLGGAAYTNTGFSVQAGTNMAIRTAAGINYIDSYQGWKMVDNTISNAIIQLPLATNVGVWYTINLSNVVPANATMVCGATVFVAPVVNQILRTATYGWTNNISALGFYSINNRIQVAAGGNDVSFILPCTNQLLQYTMAGSTNMPTTQTIKIFSYYVQPSGAL